MSEKIRVLQFGLGPIGQACVRTLVEKAGVELTGAVDIDPAKVGKDVGDVVGLKTKLGIAVRSDAALMREIKEGIKDLKRKKAKLYTLEELFD